MDSNNITVKNFGTIKKADIDIAPLTVFIGSNNTGKSFLALLIHSFLNPFDESRPRNNIIVQSLKLLSEDKYSIFMEFENQLNEYIQTKPQFSDSPFKFPRKKFDEIIRHGAENLYSSLIEKKLRNNFAENLNKLNYIKKEEFKVSFNNIQFVNKDGDLSIENFSLKTNDIIPEEGLSDDNLIVFQITSGEKNISVKLDYQTFHKIYNDANLSAIIYVLIINQFVERIKENSYYITATGDELLRDMNNHIYNYPKPPNIQKELPSNLLKDSKKGVYYDLARKLEEELFNGRITFRDDKLKEEIIFIDKQKKNGS